MFEGLNVKVAESAVGRWFRLDGSGHPKQREGSLFTTELRAGTTTFFAMAYIIAVNASILSDSGGTCAYALCKEIVRRDLITTSAAVAALASVLMGFFANLPVALAPGLGLNAYFAYSVVGFNGSGKVTYQEALAAVFLEGWLFFILSLFGVRQWLARIIPRSLTLATGAGIGLFIALIGLGSAGLGVVGGDYTNLVGLGGCTAECEHHFFFEISAFSPASHFPGLDLVSSPFYSRDILPSNILDGPVMDLRRRWQSLATLPPHCSSTRSCSRLSVSPFAPSALTTPLRAFVLLSAHRDPEHPNYCLSHVLRSPTMWLGIFVGGIFTTLLLLYRVRGAIILGILLVSIISWPRTTPVTLFPHTAVGDSNFDFFKKVVAFHKLEKIGNALDYNYGKGQVWIALITFLYVDLFDTTGTLYSMAKFSGVMNPRTRDFEGSTVAYMVDAFSISMGALMGTSPVTAFIESATGISDGGKTGITAIVTGFCFFIAVFFAPIFASIPGYATGGALVLVGSLMIKNVVDINWHYVGDAVPAFLTLIIIPFTYNIAYGLITGIVTYVLLNTLPWAIRRLSGRRISPPATKMSASPGLFPMTAFSLSGCASSHVETVVSGPTTETRTLATTTASAVTRPPRRC
ncbi:Permease family [Rhizoctonia solani]|uniref:Permease family n=1 Tax=Rhizoctonia solani TaxID=456999 RepID=A0A8H7M494_9AGAM|nr:Permease family [Rhizoctonia solani]